MEDNFRPNPSDIVKITRCGLYTEELYNSHKSHGGVTRKLNKDFYIDTRNGEVKEFKHNSNRADDLKSIARTLGDIRNLINANVEHPENALFVTLTYQDNMLDVIKLRNDLKNFFKRFNKSYSCECISVVEPQARGAWHYHLILVFPDKAPFIDNAFIANCWKQGFTKTRAIKNVDNVGAYLSAYLANMTLDEANEAGLNTDYVEIKTVDIPDDDGNIVPKKVIKGGRLSFYPAGMRIYAYSNGIKKPTVQYETAEQAELDLIFSKPIYESTKKILDTESGFENIINRRVFKEVCTNYDSI